MAVQTLTATPYVVRGGLNPPFNPGVNANPGRGTNVSAVQATVKTLTAVAE